LLLLAATSSNVNTGITVTFYIVSAAGPLVKLYVLYIIYVIYLWNTDGTLTRGRIAQTHELQVVWS